MADGEINYTHEGVAVYPQEYFHNILLAWQ